MFRQSSVDRTPSIDARRVNNIRCTVLCHVLVVGFEDGRCVVLVEWTLQQQEDEDEDENENDDDDDDDEEDKEEDEEEVE